MSPDGTINWSYVWATLILRFIGVCMLLPILILAVGISVMSKIVAMISGNSENKTSANA